jgi:hypothetical protein
MLYDRLLTRVEGFKDAIPYTRYIKNIYRDRNLDLLRCMDRMFIRDDRELFMSIEKSQEVVYHLLGEEGSKFLTPEMVNAASRLNDHASFSSLDNLTVLTFENMDRAEEILYLVEHRKLSDLATIESMLKDIDIASHPDALRSGMI